MCAKLDLITKRNINLLMFIISILGFGYAMVAQYYFNQIPCPLCIAQRIVIALLAIVTLPAALFPFTNIIDRLFGLMTLVLSLFGLRIAYQHYHLATLSPDQLAQSCALPLEIVYQKLRLLNFLKYVLSGDAECAMVNWQIFGIKITIIMLIYFTIFTILSLYLVFSRRV